MKNMKILAFSIMAAGISISLWVYYFLGITNDIKFFSSNAFWTFAMPSICVGGVILTALKKKEAKLGIFAKVLLSVLIIAWVFLVISVFTK